MACFEAEVLLRYIDAETSTDEAEEMRRHCSPCALQRRRQEALDTKLRSLNFSRFVADRSGPGI